MTTKDVETKEIAEIVCVMPDCRRELIMRLLRVLSQASDRAVELSVRMSESIVRNAK